LESGRKGEKFGPQQNKHFYTDCCTPAEEIKAFYALKIDRVNDLMGYLGKGRKNWKHQKAHTSGSLSQLKTKAI